MSASFEAVAAAFEGQRGVVRTAPGKGFGSDALRVAGKIFAMERYGGLVVKLSRERAAELLEERVATPFGSGGRTLNQWIVIAPSASRRWKALARESFRFVADQPAARPRRPAGARPGRRRAP